MFIWPRLMPAISAVAKRLLLVEDNPGDAGLIADMLSDATSPIEIFHVGRLEHAREALDRQLFDVVLLDLRLPDGAGVECVTNIRGFRSDLAIVALTGIESERLALECIAAGAQTFVGKDEISANLLRRAIAYSVVRARETEMQRRNDALLEQLRHAQRLDALGEMASGIAHDLNNTLQPIFTLVSLLEARDGNAADQKALRLIHDAALRARSLVRDVVEVGRGGVQPSEAIALDELVKAAAQLLQAGIPSRIALAVETEPVPLISARRSQIFQVLLNLVTNAAKAIGARQGTVAVRVAPANEEGTAVSLSVEDNGVGMSAETLARIFEPYFTTRSRGEGSGLGLSVVRGIVDEANGTIEVTSRLAVGTRFDMTFPAAGGG